MGEGAHARVGVITCGVGGGWCVQDNWPTVEPYFNETGSNCPSVLARQAQEELCELAVRSVQVGGAGGWVGGWVGGWGRARARARRCGARRWGALKGEAGG